MYLKSLFILVLSAVLPVVCGCTHYSGESSAKKRADRLNAVKSEARSCVDTGLYQQAIELLKPLSEEASGDQQLFIMLGESYEALGREPDAIRSYETAIRLAYSDYLPHLKLANLLMKSGRSGRALTEYELAARYGDFDAVARYDYGLALYQMGRKTRALEEWRAAYELERANPKYAEAVGIGLTDTNPGDAVQFFEEAAALGADGAGFFNNYGLALLRAGDPLAAGKQALKAVELDPESEEYRFNLAASWMQAGAFREAIPQWENLIQRFGPRWSYTVYRAEALLERGEYESAIQALAPVVETWESGELQKSVELWDRHPPDPADAMEVLAMCHRGLDNRSRALDYIEKAIVLEPDNPSILNNYGVILAENGRIEDALTQWRRVLEIDVNNATARKNLSVFEP
jgi:tetratricopeptide (TPR) repeat protein